ncbi:hypothetical protein [Bacillus sp. FJAT-49736]|uniref:hypothetical protein n=1 Tax=Bacillus sp. FJAT-49736 TaxID=2833582 RepID=UPI001BC94DF4|nr:hypothetical protein [Bacillus sp. FJAT-49736]MBS4172240.1 hypothetical protein [Bacillus sp. FJAT-49736]
MLITMSRDHFNSLKDEELPRACFEHIIPLIRGKNTSVKEEIYKKLSKKQKALFMFNAYYNHAINSLVEFYWWSSYYLAQPNAWSEIKKALQYFNAELMLHIILEIEEALKDKIEVEYMESFEVPYKELQRNPELYNTINRIFTNLNEISLSTLTIIGKNIRNNPYEFIYFGE